MVVALLVSLPYLAGISLVVFGGGQVFIPLMTQMWRFFDGQFNSGISSELINQSITVANLTPGVISTKLAFFTGYLVADGQPWGFIATLLTYSIFVAPALIMTIVGMNLIKKADENRYLKNVVLFLRPVIAGIGLSLMVQLFIGLFLPRVEFNSSIKIDEYLKDVSNSETANFFASWRATILQVFIPVVILLDLYLLRRLKIHLFAVIMINIGLGFIAFQPWRGFL